MAAAGVAVDEREFRDVMSCFCTGVVIVTGICAGQPLGFTAQSFVSVSLAPPLVAICPAKSSASWPGIRSGGFFCVNVLTLEQQNLSTEFACSGSDKFAGLTWRLGATGVPVLENVLAHVECRLVTEHEAGDHLIALGEVVRLSRNSSLTEQPLLFYAAGYGSFQRGKPEHE